MATRKKAKRGSMVIGGSVKPRRAQVLAFDVTDSGKRVYVGMCTVYADPKEVFNTMFAALSNEFGGNK